MIPAMIIIPKYRTIGISPHQNASQHHVVAFFEQSIAPWKSPAEILALTCAAYTIDTMPNGRQQNKVTRIAGARRVGMSGAAV